MPVLKNEYDGEGIDLIPDGEIVSVRLADVQPHEFEWNGEKVEKYKWVFTITDDSEWKGKEIFGDTSRVFRPHENCKAYNWAAAIAGRQFGPGEALNTDEILGFPARVIIMHKTDKQNRVWMRVREVLAAPVAARKPLSVEPEEAPF